MLVPGMGWSSVLSICGRGLGFGSFLSPKYATVTFNKVSLCVCVSVTIMSWVSESRLLGKTPSAKRKEETISLRRYITKVCMRFRQHLLIDGKFSLMPDTSFWNPPQGQSFQQKRKYLKAFSLHMHLACTLDMCHEGGWRRSLWPRFLCCRNFCSNCSTLIYQAVSWLFLSPVKKAAWRRLTESARQLGLAWPLYVQRRRNNSCNSNDSLTL